jgi:hypothetical protein
MDVLGGSSNAGTPLDGYTRNSPPSANQLWTFDPAPESGYFYIRSNLDSNMVVDVRGGLSKPGTLLEIWPQNTPSTPNQLWRFVPLYSGATPLWGYIHSLLSPNLVVDLTGGNRATKGTPLIIYPQDTPVSGNQLWLPLPAPGNNYNPYIESIVPIPPLSEIREGFSLTGAGFQAATSLLGNYVYYLDNPYTIVATGSFSATTDLAGSFVTTNFLISEGAWVLDAGPGFIEIYITLSTPGFPNTIIANWDGTAFTITSQ